MRANNRSKQLGTRQKSTAKSTAMAKVPQAHGGALNRGGTPGNKGGSGAPPQVIREKMRGTLSLILPEIEAKYKSGIVEPLDFANFLAKYGLGTKDEMTLTSEQVKGLCQAYSASVMQIVAEETPEAFLRIQARMEEQLAQVGV